jgi:hypothetical protein
MQMIRRLAWITVAIGFVLALGAVEAAAEDAQYVGVKKCKSCHKKELIGDQYGTWMKGQHSKAFDTLKGDEAIELAKTKGISGPPSEAEECLKCHATAFGLKAEQLVKGKALDLKDGVQCETCHGPGSKYKKKKTMADHDKSVAAGMLEPDAETCKQCHNDESPSWDTEKYTLADGSKAGFDYDQALEEIKHAIPEDVKGKYIEIEKQRKAEKGGADEEEEEEE